MGENFWYRLGENLWYSIGRKMTTLAFANIGCFSMAGAGLGAVVDLTTPNVRSTVGWQVETVEKGVPVTVTLRDSARIDGVYAEGQRETDEEYAEHYHVYRSTPDGADLPVPGDTITLITASGKRKSYSFLGFDRATNSTAKTPRVVLVVKRSQRKRPETLAMPKRSRILDSQGVMMTTADLTSRFVTGRLPLMSTMEATAKEPLTVETDQLVDLRRADVAPTNLPQRSVWPALNTLKKGQPIEGELRDGRRLRGVFLGIEPMAAEVYAIRYAAQQALPDAEPLPVPGSTITVIRRGGKRTVCVFHGFDCRGGPKASGAPYVLVSPVGGRKTQTVRLNGDDERIEFDGGTLSGRQMRGLVASGALPLISRARLFTQTQVPVDQIATVSASVKEHGLRTGAQIGAGVDSFLLLVSLMNGPVKSDLEALAWFFEPLFILLGGG